MNILNKTYIFKIFRSCFAQGFASFFLFFVFLTMFVYMLIALLYNFQKHPNWDFDFARIDKNLMFSPIFALFKRIMHKFRIFEEINIEISKTPEKIATFGLILAKTAHFLAKKCRIAWKSRNFYRSWDFFGSMYCDLRTDGIEPIFCSKCLVLESLQDITGNSFKI